MAYLTQEFGKRLGKIAKNGKVMLLAYDQGMEHGPSDFVTSGHEHSAQQNPINGKNSDPEFILDIAENGKFTGVVLQKGVALKYFESRIGKVPLVLKLNGRTRLVPSDEAYSPQIATVKDAVKLGADAVGYTIYVGSPMEARMFHEYSQIEAEARDFGIPTIIWSYPRGRHVPKDKEKSPEMVSYAARAALELGADIVKVNYPGKEGFRHTVEMAGRTQVISSGGSKESDDQFLQKAREVMECGGAGFAVGRNVWQHVEPLKMAEKLRKVIFGN